MEPEPLFEEPSSEGIFVVAVVALMEVALYRSVVASVGAALAVSMHRSACAHLASRRDRFIRALPRALAEAGKAAAVGVRATDALIVPAGAFLGSLAGGVLGAIAGVPPAIFTFGLSIPLGGALGSAAGSVVGVSVAAVAWLCKAAKR